MMRLFNRIVSLSITALLTLSVAFSVYAPINAQGTGMNVAYRTQEEIINYLSSHNVTTSGAVSYSISPRTVAPYTYGQISATSEQQALNMLNAIRYIAGLNDNVTIDANYRTQAQGAALINAVNRSLTHSPSQPAGMDSGMFQNCRIGAGSCNLASGSNSLNSTISRMWMSDSDGSNISRLGHRRWILNPTMGKTAFGAAGTCQSMYCFDTSNYGAAGTTGVAWPAQNTPREFFSSTDAWSVSIGQPVNAATVRVTVTRTSNGQTWTFSQAGSNGDFYVNNEGYGQTGCIIFRPSGITANAGDSYNVSITGIGNGMDINYTVNFFTSNVPSSQVVAFATRLYTTCLGRTPDIGGRDYWASRLHNHEITGTQAAWGFYWSPEYLNAHHSNDEYVDSLYHTFLGRDADPQGRAYWMNRLNTGATRESVFYGFANSVEFGRICDSYGIIR
ncbi:MAG: DUF4214 domain-containing protein [Saccharofermentans sp.]|nr:DUF4214 domain-containing protein [Saccharofermentans sp.]